MVRVRAHIHARSAQNCLSDRIHHNNYTSHFFGRKRIRQEGNTVEMMAFIYWDTHRPFRWQLQYTTSQPFYHEVKVTFCL
jgi:hypothetical protein